MSSTATSLPPFAPFPVAEQRTQVRADDWAIAVAAWTSLIEAHLALPDLDFARVSRLDGSLHDFFITFSHEVARSGPAILGSTAGAQSMLTCVFALTTRLLQLNVSPSQCSDRSFPLEWDFLADICRVHGRKRSTSLLSSLSDPSRATLDRSLGDLRKSLTHDLDTTSPTSPYAASLESTLDRLNFLISRSSEIAAFFMTGSDFLDSLSCCYRTAGSSRPSLQGVLVTTVYLCLIGLADGSHEALLTDQLYALKAAASASSTSDGSLVTELVTSTPLLVQLGRRLEDTGEGRPSTGRARSVVGDLGAFRRPGAVLRAPMRVAKRRVAKGKGVALDLGLRSEEMHGRRLAQILQVQDLFPELGSGFVARLLDEYGEDQELVVSHLLDDSLPDYLQDADRAEELNSVLLSGQVDKPKSSPAAMTRPPQHLPVRHNAFDDDALDRLEVDVSKLHFGKRDPGKTADDTLRDRAAAPDKAAILSALAAFDSDEDERDDTYDAEDVGGTVDATEEGDALRAASSEDEMLFGAWKADPKAFERDSATRRGAARERLRTATGMTDEALEGWALMLSRDPHKQRRMEARLSLLKVRRANLGGGVSGNEDSDADGGGASLPRSGAGRGRAGAGRGRGWGRGGDGRGGAGNVAGATGEKETEQARRRKEANKGARANHNRRDQRARKMARGGFPG